MTKQTYIKVGGIWKPLTSLWQNAGGVWKQDVMPYIRVAGVHKDCMEYIADVDADADSSTPTIPYTTGMLIHLDATTIDQADDTDVMQWDDLSGNNNHAYPPAAANAPHFRTAGWMGSKPAVEFNIANGTYLNHPAISSGAYNAGTTVFTVLRFTGWNRYAGVWTHSSNKMHMLDYNPDGFYAWASGSYCLARFTEGIWRENRVDILPTGRFYADIDYLVSVRTDPGALTYNQINKDRIYSRFWGGPMAEYIIFDHLLSEADVIDVENYLHNKWFV